MDCDDDEVRETKRHKMRIKRAKDNVFKINVPIITNEELERLDDVLENDLDNIVNQIFKTISKDRDIIFLKKIIDKLQKANKYLKERLEFRVNYCNELEHELYEEGNYIHKAAIRKFIKEELPDDEIMECCENFDENGVYLRKKLEELLGE